MFKGHVLRGSKASADSALHSRVQKGLGLVPHMLQRGGSSNATMRLHAAACRVLSVEHESHDCACD